jgi:hypothetical protein
MSLRPAYKVEELLALRGSASESAVSLDKFPDEDVIKGMFPFLFTSLRIGPRLPCDYYARATTKFLILATTFYLLSAFLYPQSLTKISTLSAFVFYLRCSRWIVHLRPRPLVLSGGAVFLTRAARLSLFKLTTKFTIFY